MPIASDGSIVLHPGKPQNDFISYDTGSRTITYSNYLSSVIAWNSGEYLNVIAYHGTRTGAYLIRVDTSKKELVYCVSIYGLGNIEHSQYSNSITAFSKDDLLRVHGDEGAGTYDELRNLSTGKLVYVNQAYNPIWHDSMSGRVEIK